MGKRRLGFQEIMSVMYTVGLDQKISCFATVDEAMSSF